MHSVFTKHAQYRDGNRGARGEGGGGGGGGGGGASGTAWLHGYVRVEGVGGVCGAEAFANNIICYTPTLAVLMCQRWYKLINAPDFFRRNDRRKKAFCTCQKVTQLINLGRGASASLTPCPVYI